MKSTPRTQHEPVEVFAGTLEGLEATERFAASLSRWLRAGDVVALHGDLGAGKTTLVRMLASAMGVEPAAVSSPTFVIAMEHHTSPELPDLVHIDAYRVGDESELIAVGWDRLTDGSRIVCIEWPSKVSDAIDALGGRVLRLELWPESEFARGVRLTGPGQHLADRGAFPGLEPLPGSRAQASERTETVCPVTGERVRADNPHWPFASERARMADLNRWFTESYRIERPIDERDLEEGE